MFKDYTFKITTFPRGQWVNMYMYWQVCDPEKTAHVFQTAFSKTFLMKYFELEEIIEIMQ